VEGEIFDFIRKDGEINLKVIAGKFQISESAAKFFLNHLAASGKIKADFKDATAEISKEEFERMKRDLQS